MDSIIEQKNVNLHLLILVCNKLTSANRRFHLLYSGCSVKHIRQTHKRIMNKILINVFFNGVRRRIVILIAKSLVWPWPEWCGSASPSLVYPLDILFPWTFYPPTFYLHLFPSFGDVGFEAVALGGRVRV